MIADIGKRNVGHIMKVVNAKWYSLYTLILESQHTSYKHHDDGDLLRVRVRRDIPETHRCQRRECEIERCNVAGTQLRPAMCVVQHYRTLQLLAKHV